MPLVRIRLALHGCLNRPFYHLVVANSRSKRDGKHLEQVGCYDPLPNYNKEILVGLNVERIKYWLSVGAHPTLAVSKLLGLAGLIPPHPRLYLEGARNLREAAAKETSDANSAEISDAESAEIDSPESTSDT